MARAWFDKLTMTWLTMTDMEPALSLPKGRRKRSIWTYYAAIAVRISLT